MSRMRKRRNRPADPAGPRMDGWQIVYTGFVLILLCFFVMLTSFASLQQSKITRFSRAFSHAVSVFTGGAHLQEGETMIQQGAMVVEKDDELARLFEKVRQLSQDQRLEGVGMRRTARGVVLTLSDKLLFPSAGAGLMPAAIPLLEKIGEIIRAVGVPVEIEGHTDDRPIRNQRFPSNWELSTARAVSVLRYMIQAHEVDPHEISAVGFSKYRPLAPNDSPANRSRNRRVEIIFKTRGSHAAE